MRGLASSHATLDGQNFTTDGIVPAGSSLLPSLVAFYDMQEYLVVLFYYSETIWEDILWLNIL